MSVDFLDPLPETFVAEAIRQNHVMWSGGQPLEARLARELQAMRDAGPQLLRMCGLAEDGLGLVCSLERFGLTLRDARGTFAAIGIGSVFTPPQQRGRKLAQQLVRRVMDAATASGCDAALLYSDIDPAYYERLGFERLEARRWRAAVADLPSEQPLSTRPAQAADQARLIDWYGGSFPSSLTRTERPDAHWRFFREKNASRADEVLVAADGREAGYLHVEGGKGALCVNEWACPGVPAPSLWATVAALARAGGYQELTGWVRPGSLPETRTEEPRLRSIPMLAQLTPRSRPAADWRDHAHFDALDHF